MCERECGLSLFIHNGEREIDSVGQARDKTERKASAASREKQTPLGKAHEEEEKRRKEKKEERSSPLKKRVYPPPPHAAPREMRESVGVGLIIYYYYECMRMWVETCV